MRGIVKYRSYGKHRNLHPLPLYSTRFVRPRRLERQLLSLSIQSLFPKTMNFLRF